MAKKIKSVRFDEKTLEIFDAFSSWYEGVYNEPLSFSDFVNRTVANSLANACESWKNLASRNEIVERDGVGGFHFYKFTDKQIEQITNIADDSIELYISITQDH